MYLLAPPHLIIDGVSIGCDHADKQQLYYMPIAPHLATTTSADDVEVPRFLLVKYRGSAGNGGELVFDTSLGIGPERLKEIGAKARDMLGLRDEPRLSPIPAIESTVQLMLFGKQSELPSSGSTAPVRPPTPPGPSGAPPFVLKMVTSARPSNYGAMEAAFSVSLDEAGVTIMEQALAGEMTPIGVVYSISFAALRPAYRVSVKADWERVQKHFESHFGANLWVFSSSVDKAVDELIESKIIEVQADTFVTADDDAGTVIANKDQALRQVRDMIADTFFTPSLDPWKEPKDGWDRAAGFVERFAAINPHGAEDALLSYNQKDYTRIDEKHLNVSFSERTAVRRTIWPQAHLAGFARAMAAEGIDMDRFVIEVTADSPYFAKRGVSVYNRANFAADGISSLNVHLKYGKEPKNVVFAADAAPATGASANSPTVVEWLSIVKDDAVSRPVSVSYDVDFNDEATSTGARSVSKDLGTLDGDVLEIDPQRDALYRVVRTTIEVEEDYPWDRYSAVELRLRYVDELNRIDARETLVFRPDAPGELVPAQQWKFVALDPSRTEFAYAVIHRALKGGDVVVPARPWDGDLVTISDPFPQRRRVQFHAIFDWTKYDRVYIDASCEEDSTGRRREESFEFNEKNAAAQSFLIDLDDPQAVEVHYSGLAMLKDQSAREIPPSVSRAQRIIVNDRFLGHRIIKVRLAPVDFTKRRIRSVTARLKYEDLGNGLMSEDELVFEDPDDEAHFEFDYADLTQDSYEFEVLSESTSGTTRRTAWRKSEDDLLELVLP